MEEKKLLKKNSINKCIYIYLFITIFEPSLPQIPLIYVQGIISFIYILFFRILKQNRVDLGIVKYSGIMSYFCFLCLMWLWLSLSQLIDIMISSGTFITSTNWIKSTNQLIILSLCEFLNIDIIILYLKNKNYTINDLFDMLIKVGALQGLLSIISFCIPAVRLAFLKLSGGDGYNSWLLARRGYGLSFSLLDGFGFGMGLIAGIAILKFKLRDLRNVLLQIVEIFLIVFSIAINSRTGLIIASVAFLLKLCFSNNLKSILIKIPIVMLAIGIILQALIPIINAGIGSSNININWICSDIGGLIKALVPSADINTSLTQAQSTSNPYYNNLTRIEYPQGTFQLLFGKGWQVYYGSQIGYRSDNGFVNMIWMFGIFGTVIYFAYNFIIILKNSNWLDNNTIILIFTFIALVMYSFKGRPFGYSAGIVVFYIVIFCFMYLNSKKDR